MCLHNYLLNSKNLSYLTPGLVDSDVNGVNYRGTWRESVMHDTGLSALAGSPSFNMPTANGTEVRNLLTDYFCNEGSVSWQENKIHNFF